MRGLERVVGLQERRALHEATEVAEYDDMLRGVRGEESRIIARMTMLKWTVR